jgi:hypothetical protein
MANQNLVTIFIAVVSVAVLIQAGILVGFYVMTFKMKQQADRAFAQADKLAVPMEQLIEKASIVSVRLIELAGEARRRLDRFRVEAEKAEASWHERLNRWSRPA